MGGGVRSEDDSVTEGVSQVGHAATAVAGDVAGATSSSSKKKKKKGGGGGGGKK